MRHNIVDQQIMGYQYQFSVVFNCLFIPLIIDLKNKSKLILVTFSIPYIPQDSYFT
ncbi:unnamed protein product [Paramecium sonneborni]|uniref:Uncharacterized protein n=1 Tax=Paramecium sonneborni TaxID=65129 RepID=A0A8S1RIM6_9CILI|nr:unnamed protein product [Paramecium sonneborni]